MSENNLIQEINEMAGGEAKEVIKTLFLLLLLLPIYGCVAWLLPILPTMR